MQNVTMQPSLETPQAQQGSTQAADVSAFANKGVNLESTPAADTLELSTQEQPKKSKKALLIGLGATALAAVAGTIIYKKCFSAKDITKLIKDKVNPNFSGTLKGKKGDKLVELVYDNGKLKSSLVKDKGGKEILSKAFEVLEDGSKKITTKKGDATSAVKHVMKDGKLTAIQALDKEGKEIAGKTKVFEYATDGVAKGFLTKFTDPVNKQVTNITYQTVGKGDAAKVARLAVDTTIDGKLSKYASYNDAGKVGAVAKYKDGNLAEMTNYAYKKDGTLASKSVHTETEHGEKIVKYVDDKPVLETILDESTYTMTRNKLDESGKVIEGKSSIYKYSDDGKMIEFTNGATGKSGKLSYNPDGTFKEVVALAKDGAGK